MGLGRNDYDDDELRYEDDDDVQDFGRAGSVYDYEDDDDPYADDEEEEEGDDEDSPYKPSPSPFSGLSSSSIRDRIAPSGQDTFRSGSSPLSPGRSNLPSGTTYTSGSSGSFSSPGRSSQTPPRTVGGGLPGGRGSLDDRMKSAMDRGAPTVRGPERPSSSGSSPLSASSSARRGDHDKDEDKDDKKGGGIGGRLGGLFGGKKDDEPATSKPAAQKADDKDDKKGGGIGGRFGGLIGGKKEDVADKSSARKPAGSDDDKKGGGIGGRFGGLIGGKKDDAADKSSARKPAGSDDDKKGGGIGSRFGGLTAGLPFGKKGDDEDKPASKPASGGAGGIFNRGASGGAPASSGASASAAPSRGGMFGGAGRAGAADSQPKSAAAAPSRKREKASSAEGGGFMSRVKGIFGGGDDKKSSRSAPKRTRPSQVPEVDAEDGLTLDNWLDIIGIGLVFGALVLFFSAISSSQAAISGLHRFLGQLFGWGAIAVPVAMLGVGGWLIVRRFGDEAPKVSPIRVTGLVLGFVCLLILLQFIDSFNYSGDINVLPIELELAWRARQAGGGAIGAELYYVLVTSITEIGALLIVLFTVVVSLMLMTRLTLSQLAIASTGVWRNWRDTMRKRAAARRAEAMAIAQQRALQQAEASEVSVSLPPTPELPAPPVAALPEGQKADAGLGHAIRFNRGGQSLQPVPTVSQEARQTASEAHQDSGGGLLSNLMRRNRSGNDNQESNGNGAAGIAAGLAGGLLRGRSRSSEPKPTTLPTLPENPLPLDDIPLSDTSAPAAQSATPEPESPRPESPLPAFNQPVQPRVGPESFDFDDEDDDDDEVQPMLDPRQQRLNQLRSGMSAPPSQQQQPRPQSPAPSPTDQRSAAYNSFGRPEDRITHPTEKIPYSEPRVTRPSDLPSAQPTAGPHQEPLIVPPNSQRPMSSPVVNQTRGGKKWRLPDYRTLLSSGTEQEFDRERLLQQARIIEETLQSFGAPGRVVEVNTGPVITQFGVEPDYIASRSGKKNRVKVSAIAALDKDLQLALNARSIRVEAPVPGKGYVGIEVPNEEATLVSLRDVMDDPSFQKHKSPLGIALGQSVSGAPISADLANMPHLLIAGTTGSGKSVCVNAIITSIVARNSPEMVKFIMVDPKRVELTGYNGIPHLVAPVVVELERILGVLKWVTREMDDRYKRFSQAGARNIVDYNKHLGADDERMPYIVVIIDELADLMMLAPEETERTITRIAALARATGIHLVIATQRPSVDVVTGLIKANFPARIAFAVAGGVDSRVILDQPGAERLLGKGDMLYLSGDSPAPLRLQGVYVSDMEITNIVRYWKMQAVDHPAPQPITMLTPSVAPDEPVHQPTPRGERVKQQAFWDAAADDLPDDLGEGVELDEGAITGDTGHDDELYEKAVELVRRLDKASISLLQRRLRIGYTRAARLIDIMEARGVVGPSKDGSSKPRDVLPQ